MITKYRVVNDRQHRFRCMRHSVVYITILKCYLSCPPLKCRPGCSYMLLIYETFKGVMTPLILAYVTEDGELDIVHPVFNLSVVVIDGLTFICFGTLHSRSINRTSDYYSKVIYFFTIICWCSLSMVVRVSHFSNFFWFKYIVFFFKNSPYYWMIS